jgi:hypothetical protein
MLQLIIVILVAVMLHIVAHVNLLQDMVLVLIIIIIHIITILYLVVVIVNAQVEPLLTHVLVIQEVKDYVLVELVAVVIKYVIVIM